MNTQMTALTQYSKIRQFIIQMAFVNVMNIQFPVRVFTNKTLVGVIIKRSLSIHSRTSPVVRIVPVFTFKRMKNLLFASVATKFRSIFPRTFSRVVFSAFLTDFFNNRSVSIKVLLPTTSRAIANFSRRVFGNVTRSFFKNTFAKFTRKCNAFVTSFFVTLSGAKSSSIFFKRFIACWTSFHIPSLTLAMDKVNPGGPR